MGEVGPAFAFGGEGTSLLCKLCTNCATLLPPGEVGPLLKTISLMLASPKHGGLIESIAAGSL